MALVSYGSSDSEDDDLELNEEQSSKSNGNKNDLNDQPIESEPGQQTDQQTHQPQVEDLEEELHDFKKPTNYLRLPKPSYDSAPKFITATTSNLVTSKEKNKVKIFLPSYKNKTDDDYNEDDEDERESSRFKFSSSRGSALKSLLPPPKNRVTAKTTSFLPDVLKRKAEASLSRPTKKPAGTVIRPTIDEDDHESVNFFSFDQDKTESGKEEFVGPQVVQPNKFETDLINSKYGNASIRSSITSPSSTAIHASSANPVTAYQQERKLKYEIEKRFGEEVGDNVKIQEVDIASHLSENFDYLKTVSEEKDVEVKGPAPSSMAKRKHQITYLAYQAKQNELKLKNEWAQGRMNREASRSKYGF